jgi:membrane-bound ClpP family serine protease
MTGIIFLIIIGLVLLLVEFLLIPGITVAGIGGFAFMISGIIWAYVGYGTTTGHITLIITIIASIVLITLSLRSKTWQRFTLATNMESNVETNATTNLIKPGDTGTAISRLAPMGKARINNLIVEAKSTGDYINEKSEIEVIRIEGNNVIVKLKN